VAAEIKGFIFDFDGTLADSLPGIYEGWKRTFAQLGLTPPTYEFVRRAIGPTREEYLKLLLGDHSQDLREEALKIFKDVYKNETIFQTVLYDGITELIAELNKKGMKLAIASNKPYNQILTLVDYLFGKDSAFDPILGSDSVSNGKPEPDMFLACATKWKMDTSNIIVVGDTILDMEAGRRAGMRRIAVRWGYGNNDELDKVKPDFNALKAADILKVHICFVIA
jgi:phosphoglycolate phosphatase